MNMNEDIHSVQDGVMCSLISRVHEYERGLYSVQDGVMCSLISRVHEYEQDGVRIDIVYRII